MFVCFRCKKKLETPSILIKHLKSIHFLTRQSLKLLCVQNDCNQTFTNFSYFRIHLEQIHKNDDIDTYITHIPTDCNISYIAEPKVFPSTDTPSAKRKKQVSCSLQEIKYKALMLSLSLYDKNSMPRNHVIEIQNTVSSLISAIANTFGSFVEDGQISIDLRTILNFCKSPFDDISSEYRLIKMLKNLKLYEEPKLIVIDEKVREIVCHGNPTLGPKIYDIVIMPLRFMFKSIFEIPELLDLTLKNIQESLSDCNISSFANGEIFKNIVEQFPSTIVIPYILYFDDFQINNALGSHTYSICGCYIHFPLMPKYLLSKLQFIFPAAFISTSNLKQCGNDRSFNQLVEELKQLELGIDIVLDKEVHKVSFVLGLIVGDNLAVNSILGYVQSFNSKRYCRACRRERSQMQFDNCEISENLRTSVTYTNDLMQNNYKETGVLYHEIVSHARVVSACIRAASEKEQKQQKQNQQQLQHDSYNIDASLIAEQTNSSLSSTDDTTTNTNTDTNTNTTDTSTESAYSAASSSTATTSGVVCSKGITLFDQQISPNSTAATAATITTIASGQTSKKSDNNSLERLQNRYHLLYLKAFEVQLWLDGLLRKKSSSVSNSTNEDLDSEDIDDSIDYSDDDLDGLDANDNLDGATEDDLNDVASDLESDITHNSLSYNDNLQKSNYKNHHKKQHKLKQQQHQQQQQEKHQVCHSSDIDENPTTINVSSHHHHQQHLQFSRDCIQTKIDREGGVEEEDDVEIEEEAEDGDDEDEIDSPNHKNHQLGYTKLLVTFDRSSGRSSAAAQHKTAVTLTDFEADSESSDLETIQRCVRSCNQRNSNRIHYTPMPYKFLASNASNIITGHNKRSTIGGSITAVNSADINADLIDNTTTSKLESCDLVEMQSAATTAPTLLNEHLPHKYPQTKKQQQQRITLMAVTKNAMTTGTTSSKAATAQSLGSTVVTSTTSNNSVSHSVSDNNSDSMSNSNSIGVTSNAVSSSQSNKNIVTTKLLADNESKRQHQNQHKISAAVTMNQKNVAVISPNSHKNFSNKLASHHQHYHGSNKSATVLRKHQEQHHHSLDISKFNRSNRKSKNCAIFYFKHLDTDNETNYSNSNCDDDCHDEDDAGAGSDGGNNDHFYGEDVDGVVVDDDDGMGNDNDNIVGGLLSSSAASSSHTSDLLKSADVSSDDEGWLYTSAPVATSQQQQQNSFESIESLNSNNFSRGIPDSTEIHFTDDDLQSTAASSSTAAAAAVSDDSDRENKVAKTACTSSLTQIVLATNQTFTASTTIVDSSSSSDSNTNSAQLASNSGNPSGSCSSSSIMSSSCSSNDQLTEATTTTSTKTITTEILKYPMQKQQKQSPLQYRAEMELQINNNNSRHQIMMKENLLSATAAASMPHLIINHKNNNNNNNNSNCANNPPPSLIANSLLHIQNQHHCADKTFSHNAAASTAITSANDVNANDSLEKENIRFYTRADICNIRTPSQGVIDNNNHYHHHQSQQQLANINGSPASSPLYGAQQFLHVNVGKRLPPRSPAKSSISHASTNTSTSTISPTKGKVSHESIKQLVLEAEHLVRDEALKTPTKQKHSSSSNNNNNSAGGGNTVQISTTIKKREVIMPGPIKRVQEWLEHQPSTPAQTQKSSVAHQHSNDDHHRHLSTAPASTAGSPMRTDDCEASGEASETDSVPQQCSDTSEVSDSVATCMQTSTNSYGNSTERIGGSAEPIVNAATSNQSLNVKVVKRSHNRRKSERPWSVSCLSQLTTDANQADTKVNTISNAHSGLASHSISESALDSLSPGRPRASSSSAVTQVKSYDSKGSLKRRKTRKKKLSFMNGKKSDTNSEDNNNHQHHHHHHNLHYSHYPSTHQEDLTTLTPNQPSTLLVQSYENMTPQQMQEIKQALLQLQNSETSEQLQVAACILQQHQITTVVSGTTNESEEENHLMKPNFRVGSFTTAYMTNEARLGSLAALAYMNDEEQQGEYNTTGTEDHHSSFSETAWDNYQEKYNSENYSEGVDSDAARKLLEFNDDYRNFIDSQSDCCSSLSAANNVDSLSPPRMDSLQQNELKIITQDTIASSVDHARRRRALELEYERRRKNLEIRRKSCQESLEYHNPKSPAVTLSSSAQALTPKNSERFNFQHKSETATRKLEFGMSHSAQSLRRTSESDTSQRRRKADERRRSSRNLEKCIKLIPATSSSSGDDTDDEKEIRNLLQQSHNRLEDTKALKIRCHLLRPEDYTEIINTCRDNIRCLESVLRGPTSSVLSSCSVTQSKDLLAAWEDLLGWSENAAAARKMQEDMIVLKHALNRLGNKSSFELLDTEPSIQIAIETLKNEKIQLQTYRTSMLKLNASVHSWLTRQERRLQNALVEQQLNEAVLKVTNELLEEKDEFESEYKSTIAATKQETAATIVTNTPSLQAQSIAATASTKSEVISMIPTVTDCGHGGDKEQSHASTSTVVTSCAQPQMLHSSSSCSGSEKNWDLQTLITSEAEFHKHLKDEVSDMYTAWDEADARINTQLEVLTSSLIAWRQLEYGLSEFQLALGQDRGTLKGLEGALNTGQATPGELAQNVKLVAKLLSEKVNVSPEQLSAVQDYLDPNHILYIAKFTASNGSLSDSGISDGGTTSDGGLSERERRLGVLRRLAKQLESALAPGSEAMKSIAARMESAEIELKSLQNTCRDLIVRTAASHQNKKQQKQQQEAEISEKRDELDRLMMVIKPGHQTNGHVKVMHEINGKEKQSAQGENDSQVSNKRNKRRNKRNSTNANSMASDSTSQNNAALQMGSSAAGDGDDDPSDDPTLGYELDTSDDELTPKSKRGWGWRIAKIAVPMQLALVAVYCAANLMQPNCCDNINNFSMSFSPQLRYIRGPPPI